MARTIPAAWRRVASMRSVRRWDSAKRVAYAAKVAAEAGTIARSRPFWAGASRFAKEIARMRRLGLSVSEASFALILLTHGASYEEAVDAGEPPPEVA